MSAFAPETIVAIGRFPVTNTIISTVLVDGIIIVALKYLTKHFKKVPGYFQNLIELLIDTFYGLTESVAGENTPVIFPYFMAFFLFILIANWIGLIPGIGTFGFFHGKEFTPLIRNLTSDLNATLGLSIISLVATHRLAIQKVGIKMYLSRYFSFNPIYLFVGILEIVSEFTKMISLSFRLFGNIFAGEVVLTTIAGISAFLFPIPFLMLEIIVGLIQALVFSMLTMVFMSVLMTPHHSDEHEVQAVKEVIPA